MASASDSTPTPSRRKFFGSAIGSGVAAAMPPTFVAGYGGVGASLSALIVEHERANQIMLDNEVWGIGSEAEWAAFRDLCTTAGKARAGLARYQSANMDEVLAKLSALRSLFPPDEFQREMDEKMEDGTAFIDQIGDSIVLDLMRIAAA